MEVEFTARQVKITRDLRTLAEEGMERIALILGKNARASIVFSAQKRLQIVEVTIQARLHTIVAEGKAESLESALRQAIEHAESQVRRRRDRRMAIKRKPQQEKALAEPSPARHKTRAVQPWRTSLRRNPSAPKEKPARPSPCTPFRPARRSLSRASSPAAKPLPSSP
jgi:putative sigma-54 modulation protein